METHNEHLSQNNRIATKWFNGIVESLSTVESPEQLFAISIDIKKQFGFNSINFGLVMPNNFRGQIYCIFSDEPEEWKQSYIQNEYWKTDTRIIMARNQLAPFCWSKLSYRADFITEIIMRDVFDGMTVPVHGPNHFFGFLHFTYCPNKKKISSWLKYIQPFIVYLSRLIIEAQSALIRKGLLLPLHYGFSKNTSTLLTTQQRMCLAWAAEGKTTEEIARILVISVSTVNKHLDSASTILNANNRTHAIVKAIDSGIVALTYKKKPTIFYF